MSKGKPLDRTPEGVHPQREIVSLFYFPIMKKILSIFIDESGNVGFDSEGASEFYIVSMIFHDQCNDISRQLDKIKGERVFHVGPIINGKDEYANMTSRERQKLLNKILIFTSITPILQKTFVYDKNDFNEDKYKLLHKISNDLNSFLLSNQEFFLSFDQIIVYYDDGQQIVSNALAFAFGGVGYNVTFKEKVRPGNYRLFQVADFVSTIVLIGTKLNKYKKLSKIESAFFDERHLKNLFLRTIKKKELK